MTQGKIGMVERWIHQKCAQEGDTPSMGDGILMMKDAVCDVCGEHGRVVLHWCVEREEGESIVFPVPEEQILQEIDESIEELAEEIVQVEEETEEVGTEAIEEAPEPEREEVEGTEHNDTVGDVQPEPVNETPSKEEQIRAQIAELEALLEENSTD